MMKVIFQGSMVEKFDIVITPLGLERTIHVYLPEDILFVRGD